MIRNLPDQGMLEQISRLWRQTALVEQLGVDKPGQSFLQQRLVQRCHGLEQLIRECSSQDRPQLGHGFDRRQAIQSGHERVVQRGGNR